MIILLIQKSAEKQFFSEIFKLIFNCSNEYFFIIKAKYNKLNLEKYYESDRLRNTFAKDKKFVFINPDIPSHKIINSSDAVISMAFTSPSIEALCKNKPAVFDPKSLAYENHFKNIDGIYLNNISDLEIFIETIKDKEKTFKWVSEIKHEIRLNDKNQGIFDIHKDIENFFLKIIVLKKYNFFLNFLIALVFYIFLISIRYVTTPKNMKVVILAGGFGTRLSEYTSTIPKPMVTIGGYPILWHIMQIFSKYNHTDFYCALGYKSEVIKEYFYKQKILNSDFTIDLSNGRIDYHKLNSIDWKVTS